MLHPKQHPATSQRFHFTNVITGLFTSVAFVLLVSMRLSYFFLWAFIYSCYPSIFSSLLLYFYPVTYGCEFPSPPQPKVERECIFDEKQGKNVTQSTTEPERPAAPFRLLVLGDPQLEGDTSLPDPTKPNFPSISTLRSTAFTLDIIGDVKIVGRLIVALVTEDLPHLLGSYRKRLDLLGNDYYLAHIYRTLHWWLQPTHTAVLGDLIGSQWVSNEEFERRGWRFWNRVFRNARRVEDEIAEKSTSQILGQDPGWFERVINVVGNHDIGYAGDIDRTRVDRFEKIYGKVNWDISFQLPKKRSDGQFDPMEFGGPPELRIVVLNSMNLDSPTRDQELQDETFDFMNRVITTQRPVQDRKAATILLTHIPLHKEAGTCFDDPFIDVAESGIREQNHLSPVASKNILEGIFGMSAYTTAPGKGLGRNGIILTGHDHEGCDVYHYIPNDLGSNETEWQANRWYESRGFVERDIPGLREITIRSMMGSFWGNAGLLSAWFDYQSSEWQFEMNNCYAGVQHVWWAVHAIDSISILLFLSAGIFYFRELVEGRRLMNVQVTGKVSNVDLAHEAANKSPDTSDRTGNFNRPQDHRGLEQEGGSSTGRSSNGTPVRKRKK